ncbi:hypothetical protein FHT00_001451 [Sphingomonas insulae]|uniref:Uncharacterized protein n=1 Tax=Sphingomonas insulae TaxID=424800 RepID=A0ABN1HYQ6_9SPHN|nr:hypothetical protein [Sphingomonas insulae]NIJ29504.1 hypothetical protein [Sphingomonas insulae]
MADTDPNVDAIPDDAPDAAPDAVRDDERPDIQQAVEARADAVARGEGGSEPVRFTDTGEFDGNSGTGGEVKNQDLTQQ